LELKINFFRRYLFILCIILISYFSYGIYKEDIYDWFCKNEDNEASCMVSGLIQKEKRNFERANYYFEKSCELGYVLGCVAKGRWEAKNGRKIISRVYFLKACKLGEEKFCLDKGASPTMERP
jgi:hypothetical protein